MRLNHLTSQSSHDSLSGKINYFDRTSKVKCIKLKIFTNKDDKQNDKSLKIMFKTCGLSTSTSSFQKQVVMFHNVFIHLKKFDVKTLKWQVE